MSSVGVDLDEKAVGGGVIRMVRGGRGRAFFVGLPIFVVLLVPSVAFGAPRSSIEVQRNDFTGDRVSDLVGIRSIGGCLARWKGNTSFGLSYVGDAGCGWGDYTSHHSNEYRLEVATGDINRDGIGDLVGIRNDDGCLARWTGNSGFGFRYIGDYGCGWNSYYMLTGIDLNNDATGDLVAIRKSDGCLARWTGNGNGGFTYIGDYSCGWEAYIVLTSPGDFNRDGIGDLLGVTFPGCLERMRGNGYGGFTYIGHLGCTWGSYWNVVGMGDLNRDGVGDFVAYENPHGDLEVYKGDGNGGFTFVRGAGGGWEHYALAD